MTDPFICLRLSPARGPVSPAGATAPRWGDENILLVTITVLLAAVSKENLMTDTFDPARLLNHTMARAPTVAAGPAATVAVLSQAGAALAPPPPLAPLLFHTVEEVARTLGVSRKTVDRRIRDGVIGTVPMGGRLVRISSAELQRLAAAASFRPAR
jgi:excisionase family DNA binding protein